MYRGIRRDGVFTLHITGTGTGVVDTLGIGSSIYHLQNVEDLHTPITKTYAITGTIPLVVLAEGSSGNGGCQQLQVHTCRMRMASATSAHDVVMLFLVSEHWVSIYGARSGSYIRTVENHSESHGPLTPLKKGVTFRFSQGERGKSFDTS